MPTVTLIGLGLGCGINAEPLPQTPPTQVKKLTSDGLHNIGGVASSPDGETFYALAFDDKSQPGVFKTRTDNGEVTPLLVGDPLLYPSDIAVSCDGGQLYVSDMGLGSASTSEFAEDVKPEASGGGIHVIATDSGDRHDLQATGIGRAAGLVLSKDCETLYVTGWTTMGVPALFTVPVEGGSANVVAQGAPLVSPTGVDVDVDNVAWVMDHLARGSNGQGMLLAINEDGDISEVVSGLGMGRHGGVSLTPGGTTAVIPVRNDLTGASSLITANTQTLEVEVIDTPDIPYPTGVASARNAPVMVVAGEYGLHIATFE
ncbi:MAG: hypothetical protein JKY37_05310 [Nannocystaceae bacterium]|nr:hypothetical protein [Nannocystaceae bacterium]